jgi:hypothetical protein
MCTTLVYHSGGRNPLMLQETLGNQGFLAGLVPGEASHVTSNLLITHHILCDKVH